MAFRLGRRDEGDVLQVDPIARAKLISVPLTTAPDAVSPRPRINSPPLSTVVLNA